MTTHALFDTKYGTGDVVLFSQAWDEPIAVLHDVENGNIDSASVSITNSLSGRPTVYVDRDSGAGSSWRHFMFGVSGAEGKRPLYQINRATKDGASFIAPTYKPVSTQDFNTWTQADTMNLVGGTSGTIEWEFAAAHVSGTTYLSNCPVGRFSEAANFASNLLIAQPTVVSPIPSADSSGVYYTTPAETNHLGNAVGGNDQYGLKLTFSETPNDGFAKRTLVITEGIHAAGEAQQWFMFKGMVEWLITSNDTEAIALRENWDVYIFFVANPNGLRGGNFRLSFRSSADPNRQWDNPTLEETLNLRDTISSDVGSADAAFHAHGDVYTTANFQGWVHPDDHSSSTRSPAMQTMMDEGATIFGESFDSSTSGTFNNDVWWTKDVLGCRVSFDTELAAMPEDTSVSYFNDIGQKWLKTLQATDATGAFSPAGTLTISAVSQAQTAENMVLDIGEVLLSVADANQIQNISNVVLNIDNTVFGSAAMHAPLTHSLILEKGSGDPSYTRSTEATVLDNEGKHITVPSGVARFEGARLVANLYSSTDTLSTQNITTTNDTYTVSFKGTGSITFSGTHTGTLNGTGVNDRVEQTFTATAGTLTSTVSGSVTEAQCEKVSGQDDQTASEYVSSGTLSAPWHGAGADGSKWFNTNKDSSSILDSSLKGLKFRVSAATNECLYSRDLTNAAWTKSNITATRDQIGTDNVANRATRLTATAANGTCLQSITLSAADDTRVFHAWIKRSIGTGPIEVTRNGGFTWVDITGSLDDSTFFVDGEDELNPTVGFRIVTSGDEIIVDRCQDEAGFVPTEPIDTEGSAVTRDADQLSYQTSGNISDTNGAIRAVIESDDWSNISGSIGSATTGLFVSGSNSGVEARDGTNTATGPAGTPSGKEIVAIRWRNE